MPDETDAKKILTAAPWTTVRDHQNTLVLLLLLLVWQAPLGVRSAKRRHQSPEWTILSHSYRLIQGEIV